jgi:hypothetical protein
MAGVYGEINSRADFQAVLDQAIADGKALLAQRPGDETIDVIVRQLEAVKTWSANGRTPTKEERESIDMGVRASRELEGDDEAYVWTRALYALDAYIEDWPSDEKAANATDDDFWDSDDDEDDDE